MLTTRPSGIFLMHVLEASRKISPSHDFHAKFELIVELKTKRPKFMKMVSLSGLAATEASPGLI